MKNRYKPFAFPLVAIVALVSAEINTATAQLSGTVSLISRGPHLNDDATGNFKYSYDNVNNKLTISDGNVTGLTSKLHTPNNSTSAIHVHRFYRQGDDVSQPPPLVFALDVNEHESGLEATFQGTSEQLSDAEQIMFRKGMMFVLVHTKKNQRGEVAGYIGPKDAADPLSFQTFDSEHPLFKDYRNISQFPVLPLSRHEVDPLIDDPFPPYEMLKQHPEFLDRRRAGNDQVKAEKERYLRMPVAQVEKDGSITAGGTDTRRNSYFDHPNPQPRPLRPMHLRYASELESFEDNVLQQHPLDLKRAAEKRRSEKALDSRAVAQPPGQTDPSLEASSAPPVGSISIESAGHYDHHRTYAYTPYLKLAAKGPMTYAETPPAMYPEVDPFKTPPGTNLLPTVYENMRDRQGHEMVNTLPSHPNRPYNLHDGDPIVERLQTLSSPTDDLRLIMDDMFEAITGKPIRRLWEELDRQELESVFKNVTDEEHESRIAKHRDRLIHHAEWAIDILEGNDGRVIMHGCDSDNDGKPDVRESRIPGNRAYRGFALLHHSGHKRANRVTPIYDEHGKIVAGHVDVRQVWYDGRIESNTMFYDFGWDDVPIRVRTNGSNDYEEQWFSSTDENLTRTLWDKSRNKDIVDPADVEQLTRMPEPIPHNVPLQATFEVSILNRGEDDFSPTIVYFDAHEKVHTDVRIDDKLLAGGKTICAPDKNAVELDHSGKVVKRAEWPWGKLHLNGRNVPMRYGPPHIAMDATFFPMAEGTRTKLRLNLSDVQYHNVHYTWGWRKHPPRAQAVENMHKRLPPAPGTELKNQYRILWDHATAEEFFGNAVKNKNLTPRLFRLRMDDHERFVFEGVKNIDMIVERYLMEEMARCPQGKNESDQQHEERIRTKLRADFQRLSKLKWLQPPVDNNPISKIADIAPAKLMWKAFVSIRKTLVADQGNLGNCLYDILEARAAYLDWKDRNHLPSGIKADRGGDPKPDESDSGSDLTLLYVNNTMYGEFSDGSLTTLGKWRRRGAEVKITLINGDYFIHGYVNPDFGGLRGYENQFKPTLAVGGQGSMFTFGRFNWRFNVAGGAVPVPPCHFEVVDPATGTYSPVPMANYDLQKRIEVIDDGVKKMMPQYKVVPGVQRIMTRYNFEPSRRLRFYQFDPLHHDVAIYSIH